MSCLYISVLENDCWSWENVCKWCLLSLVMGTFLNYVKVLVEGTFTSDGCLKVIKTLPTFVSVNGQIFTSLFRRFQCTKFRKWRQVSIGTVKICSFSDLKTFNNSRHLQTSPLLPETWRHLLTSPIYQTQLALILSLFLSIFSLTFSLNHRA